ncbi:hypothetical protein [Aquisphaera giovannonii]|uniref:hypothetical protein n=1 Tax=Aquisphaera giovannonii TaxID=406548 RepID=UPI00143CDE70|nr:hypothetical protein [Aquisphaera giovannonii]
MLREFALGELVTTEVILSLVAGGDARVPDGSLLGPSRLGVGPAFAAGEGN